jgi:hypothetical protein
MAVKSLTGRAVFLPPRARPAASIRSVKNGTGAGFWNKDVRSLHDTKYAFTSNPMWAVLAAEIQPSLAHLFCESPESSFILGSG